MGKTPYRADIDGLRALAVLSVILFHINPKWLGGGFLGVDVFFVISGYLISMILIKDLERKKTVDFALFYERRIRRIFPALLFVLLVTSLIAFQLLLPKDLAQYFKSLVWSVLSFANIFFYHSLDTSYFASPTSEVPLLHLWSLGVEEQFYFLYPALLLFLYKVIPSKKRQSLFITLLLVSSLVAAQMIQARDQEFAHYMLLTRAWELLAGGLCAFLVSSGFYLKKITSESLSFLGLTCLLGSFYWITENDSVPGLACLPIILGTSLLILSQAKHKTFVGSLLSFKPFVLIGLISYSAYLWHWPLLAFLRYSLIQIDLKVGIGVLISTLLLAAFSYKFVEQPFRKITLSRKKIYLRLFLAPSLTLCLISFVILRSVRKEHSWIFPWEKISHINEITKPAYKFDYNCQYALFTVDAYEKKECVYPEGKKPTALLLGDSHASHYLGMLRVFAKEFDFTLANYIQSSCPLVFDVNYDWINKRKRESCALYRKSIKNHLRSYETLFVGGSWGKYDRDSFREDFRKSVSYLAKQANKVVLLAQVPRMRGYTHECEMRSLRNPSLNCKKRFNNKEKSVRINRFMKNLAKEYSNVFYFDIRDSICPKGLCSPYLDGKPVYFDSSHLSMMGSKSLGERLLKEKPPSYFFFKNKIL